MNYAKGDLEIVLEVGTSCACVEKGGHGFGSELDKDCRNDNMGRQLSSLALLCCCTRGNNGLLPTRWHCY